MCARATLFHGVVCVERANICTAGAAARASTFSARSIHVYVSSCIRMFTCARICVEYVCVRASPCMGSDHAGVGGGRAVNSTREQPRGRYNDGYDRGNE